MPSLVTDAAAKTAPAPEADEQKPPVTEEQPIVEVKTEEADPQGASQEESKDPDLVIPEAYKGLPEFKDIKSWKGFVDSYVNAQKMIGQSYRLPKEGDDAKVRQEKISEMHRVLGRPDGPDKYELGDLPELPNGIEWSPDMLTEFKTKAFNMGLSNEGAQQMIGSYAESLNTLVPDLEKQAQETEKNLREEMGDAVFEQSLVESAFAARHLAKAAGLDPDEVMTFLDKTGLGSDPMFIKMFAVVGRDYREDGTISGAELGTQTLADINAEISAIQADKSDPYNNAKHGKHKERVDYVNSLHALAAAREKR